MQRLKWFALPMVLAFSLAWFSEALFSYAGFALLKWLPNVGAVILAFSLSGRRFALLLGGHAIGLALSGFELQGQEGMGQLHHVAAETIETGLMLLILAKIAPDARLVSSGDFLRVGLGVMLFPALVSSLMFALGESVMGRPSMGLVLPWVKASIGISSIILVPWLVIRSHLIDAPLDGKDVTDRRIRVGFSWLIVLAALALPLTGRTDDEALVALLLLLASAWLPVPVVAILISTTLVLHDSDLRHLLGLGRDATNGDEWNHLRDCLIGLAALYVRLLLAENRSALTRVEHERTVRTSEAKRFEDLIDQIDGIVWEADAATARLTFVSGGAERLLGYAPDAWLAPDFWATHMHPEDRDCAVAYCAAETRARRGHMLDYRFLAKDGRSVWIRDVVTVVPSPQGQEKLAGVMLDITAEKQASLDLAAATSSLEALALRHRLALTAGGIGIWEADVGTGESEWDETMFQLFGSEASEAATPRQLMKQRMTPESAVSARVALAQLRSGSMASYTEDYAIHLPDGTLRRLRSVVAPMIDEEGRTRAVGATWDCSTEYLAEEALKKRADQLANILEDEAMQTLRARVAAGKAEALQADMVANVSHELRTPLHAILGFIDLAREDLSGDEAAHTPHALRKLDRAMQAAKRLLLQVDDLLDLSKIESGVVALHRERLDFRTLVFAIRDELFAMTTAKAISIELEIRDLPCTLPLIESDGLWVEVDELRMLQVLRNVLANAVRFSPSNSVIKIDLSEGRSNELPILAVTISDSGPGIPQDQLASVFEKFVQVRESKAHRGGGTGLGLPIARQIARAHGGDLWAVSTARGACFQLTIPASKARQ